jgi:hypothetical protein
MLLLLGWLLREPPNPPQRSERNGHNRTGTVIQHRHLGGPTADDALVSALLDSITLGVKSGACIWTVTLRGDSSNIALLVAVKAFISGSLRRVDVAARDFSPLCSALDFTVLISEAFTFFAAFSPDFPTGRAGLLTWMTGIVGVAVVALHCACALRCCSSYGPSSRENFR